MLCVLAVVGLVGMTRPGSDNAADKDKAARELLDRAIRAHGGEEKLNRFRGITLTMTGHLAMGDRRVPFQGDWAVQLPDKLRSTVEAKSREAPFKQTQVVNGSSGWLSRGGRTVAMDAVVLAEAREELHSGWEVAQLTPLRRTEYRLTVTESVRVEGKETLGLVVSRPGFRDVRLYFDRDSHLLVKTATQARDLATDRTIEVETVYSDYGEVQGVKYPRRVRLYREGQEYLNGVVSEYRIQETLSNDRFVKP
jgi:hypothetical protein